MTIAALEIDLGDAVVLTETFTVSSVATDPTTVSLEVKSPAGTVTTYTYAGAQIARTSAGVYTKTLGAAILNAAGAWHYSWIGTGTAEGVDQGVIGVIGRNSAA